jgi:DNA-directed RNA polymerase subunit RPC12/RpoP
MAADDPKFICTACGKEYRWKPELAGRKAKCGCGASIVVPAERPATGGGAPAAKPAGPPAAAPAPTRVFAPTAETIAAPAESSGAKCPACSAALAPNAVLCVNCGYNLKTGKTLSVVVERDEDEPDDQPPAKAAAATAATPVKSAKPAP